MNPDDEIALLKLLERRVRRMFTWTGWEDDVDDEPRRAVLKVMETLNQMDDARKVMRAARRKAKHPNGEAPRG